MDEGKSIICQHCGAKNIEGSKKCYKCNNKIGKEYLSCPRCAKKNELGTTRCVSCGFNFKRKRLSIWFNLLFSLILVGILLLCVRLEKIGVIKHIGIAFRVVAVLIILGSIIFTFTYGKKDVVSLDPEEELAGNNPRIKRLKLISSITVCLAVIAAAIFIIFKFILKK